MKILQKATIKFTQFFIRCYQIFISPSLGAHCRFVPTCSEYASEAVEKLGIFRGAHKAASRLLRCHPLHSGGYDPVCK